MFNRVNNGPERPLKTFGEKPKKEVTAVPEKYLNQPASDLWDDPEYQAFVQKVSLRFVARDNRPQDEIALLDAYDKESARRERLELYAQPLDEIVAEDEARFLLIEQELKDIAMIPESQHLVTFVTDALLRHSAIAKSIAEEAAQQERPTQYYIEKFEQSQGNEPNLEITRKMAAKLSKAAQLLQEAQELYDSRVVENDNS